MRSPPSRRPSGTSATTTSSWSRPRAYAEEDGPGRRSAAAALRLALRAYLRLFAPFLPFVTEEVWSWRFAGDGIDGSIHTSRWPSVEELDGAAGDAADADAYAAAVELSQQIRGAKTRAQRSLRWPVAALSVRGAAQHVDALRGVLDDVLATGNVDPAHCELGSGDPPEGQRFAVDVELAPEAGGRLSAGRAPGRSRGGPADPGRRWLSSGAAGRSGP